MRKAVLILGHSPATQFIDIFNQYTRLFDKEKYEVTVAYLTGKPDDGVRERTLAEHVLFLNVPKKSLRYLKIQAIRKLLTLCRKKQFQIVICHRYKPIYLMLWVAKFYSLQALVCVMHELRTMTAIGRRLLIACLARKNVLFAGVSNAVRDDLRASLWCVPKKRIVTLYNMIDIDLTEPHFYTRYEAREALHLTENTFVFGNVARLARNKDQATLITAFQHIKPQCPNAKLILIGNGDYETQLRAQAKAAGLENDIIFTGYLPSAFRYLKALDCFVLSSIQEAFGRVLLEAMIAKLPVIATSVHGIPEVVQSAGYLVKPRDPAMLAAAMKRVYELSVKARNETGEKAYMHVTNHFSIPQFHQQFWQLPLIKTIME